MYLSLSVSVSLSLSLSFSLTLSVGVSQVKASKQVKFVDVPNNLMVHLHRVKSFDHQGRPVKSTTRCTFKDKTMLTVNNRDFVLNLSSVLVHR